MKKYFVHWLLIDMVLYCDIKFLCSFTFSVDNAGHNYFIYRKLKSNNIECFSIIRTSSKCWRLIYSNTRDKVYTYKSFRLVCDLRRFIMTLYYKYNTDFSAV